MLRKESKDEDFELYIAKICQLHKTKAWGTINFNFKAGKIEDFSYKAKYHARELKEKCDREWEKKTLTRTGNCGNTLD